MFACLFALNLGAQPAHIDADLWKALKPSDRRAVRAQVRALEADRDSRTQDASVDFWIPVEESIFLPLSADVLSEGNWSRAYLEVPQNEAKASGNFRGKALVWVLDTGEADHTDVRRHMLPGTTINFTPDASGIDGHNHSTHVAGSIVATVSGTKYGVNTTAADAERLKLIFYKVCTNNGGCSYQSIQQAIEKAIQEAPNYKGQGYSLFMNLSIGGSYSAAVDALLKRAKDAGIIICAANGNNGTNQISFPGSSAHTLGIGALSQNGARASFSNYGPETFLAAPGVSVPATCKGNTICALSGTSMATPQACGMLAYIAIMRPEWSTDQLVDFAAKNATDIATPGFDHATGWGAPMLGKYITGGGTPPPPPPPPPAPEPPTEVFPGRYAQYEILNPGNINYIVLAPKEDEVKATTWLEGYAFAAEEDGRLLIGGKEGWPGIELNRQFPVTKIVFWGPAESRYQVAYTEAVRMSRAYFTNRGHGIPHPADEWRAVQVAGYFFELVNEMFEEYPVRVLRIEATTAEGAPIVLEGKDLWHWRNAPAR